jgi:hypothetical protein
MVHESTIMLGLTRHGICYYNVYQPSFQSIWEEAREDDVGSQRIFMVEVEIFDVVLDAVIEWYGDSP